VTSTLYKVETEAVEVDVSFAHEKRMHGQMFLRPSIVSATGIESIADRLNDRKPFFPLRVRELQGQTVLLGKHQVRFVARAVRPAEQAETVRPCTDQQLCAVLEFESGEELVGAFRLAANSDFRRLLDYINYDHDMFVPFYADRYEYVINRFHIRSCRELEK
jgi:hypothetical protein